MVSNITVENDISVWPGRILLVFYCLIFIFGLIGNSMVIYVAIRKKNYRNVTNCYVINLAIADLLFLTLSIPYTTYLGVQNTDPFGDTVCKIYTYLAYGFLQATCNILAVMSIDRYLYIVRSNSKLGWRTPRNAFKICIVIWASSLILIIPYHIISRVLIPNSTACGMNEHGSLIVCLFPFCSYYAVPLLVIIVCYTNLAMHVIKTGRTMADHMNTTNFHKIVQLKQRRVTKMVIGVTLAFAICWLPIHVLELMKCANSKLLNTLIRSYPEVLYSIRAVTHALAYFNSCLNPYLYAILNRNFCIDLVDIMPAWGICCKQAENFENKHFNASKRCPGTIISRNQVVAEKYKQYDDNDEIDCCEQKPIMNDINCQVELLRIKSDQHNQDISSITEQTELT
ncbi:unnamed protein product [Adineta steineri]|uniref:G-protein coupled receptors family 1 profile domain-containing protein n=2 Tax=Adineta steineri TaxID=433720 RepID=A0A819ARH2_9BILA|nr:unnamed protein product [Adineta steineri]